MGLMRDPRVWLTLIVCGLCTVPAPAMAGAGTADTYVVVGVKDVPADRVARARRVLVERGVAIAESGADARAQGKARTAAASRFGKAIETARGAYLTEKYDDAIAALEAVEQSELGTLLESPQGRALLVDLNMWVGALHYAAGRTSDADRRFRLAVSLDASARLDGALWPPDYVKRFENAAKRTLASGAIVVESEPPGASVQIDGRDAGSRAPVTNRPTAGWHYVFVIRLGHARHAERVQLDAGGVITVTAQLGVASAAQLAVDASNAMVVAYPGEPSHAARVIAAAAGAGRVAVVTADGVVVYGANGKALARATGSTIASSVDAAFSQLEPRKRGGGKSGAAAPIYKRWWFWAGVGVVAGSVGLYAATRGEDDGLRGEFVSP